MSMSDENITNLCASYIEIFGAIVLNWCRGGNNLEFKLVL